MTLPFIRFTKISTVKLLNLILSIVKSEARMNDFPEDNLNRFSPHINLSTALLL